MTLPTIWPKSLCWHVASLLAWNWHELRHFLFLILHHNVFAWDHWKWKATCFYTYRQLDIFAFFVMARKANFIVIMRRSSIDSDHLIGNISELQIYERNAPWGSIYLNRDSSEWQEQNCRPTIFVYGSVANPGFPRRRSANPWIWANNLLFEKSFAENCVKMKEIVPRGGDVSLAPTLDPPMWIAFKNNNFKEIFPVKQFRS